ncbi:hypothetical protein ACGFJ7_27770 [Actinoplanes sp. NPDC048988]|uniref:hypothetical protein n=1 Tax=Actinoplanes sp. NPDC048988 TaxID=3363901 RepID=UPI00371AF6E8
MADLVAVEDFTYRQKIVNLIPAMLAIGIVGLLIIAGAPDQAPDLDRLTRRIGDYGWNGVAVLTLGSVFLALLLEPFELGTVRFLEGYWSSTGWLHRAAVLGVWLQERKRSRLQWIFRTATDDARRQEVSAKLSALPMQQPLMPTQLGNTLRGMEERAGAPYELDAIYAWPRLYEALPEQTLKKVGEARNQLDVAARLCLSLATSAVIATVILAPHGWWLLAPLGLLLLAIAAYRAAIAAAMIYGDTICSVIDVHRLKLLQMMRLEMPLTLDKEREINKILAELWAREFSAAGDLKYSRTDSDVGLHHR